jgi:hypothetical protein
MISRFWQWLRSDPDRRSASRESGAGLTAFYWDGGTPRGHRVRDISRRGAFVETGSSSWADGTLMMLTLQIDSSGAPGDPGADAIVVQAQVVRTCTAGMGIKFLLPDLNSRRRIAQFLARWKSNPPVVKGPLKTGSEEAVAGPRARESGGGAF